MQPPCEVFLILAFVIMWVKLEKPGASTYIGVEMRRAINQADTTRMVTVLIFLLVAYLQSYKLQHPINIKREYSKG